MPTLARSAYGTELRIGASLVPEIVNIEGLGSRVDLFDVSAHDGNGYSSEIAGLKRNNPITVTMNYVPGNTIQNQLKAQYDARTSTAYSVTIPGTPEAAWSFNAVVSQWQLNPLGVSTAPQLVAILNPDGEIVITTTALMAAGTEAPVNGGTPQPVPQAA